MLNHLGKKKVSWFVQRKQVAVRGAAASSSSSCRCFVTTSLVAFSLDWLSWHLFIKSIYCPMRMDISLPFVGELCKLKKKLSRNCKWDFNISHYLVGFDASHFLHHEIATFQVDELHIVLGTVSPSRDDFVECERKYGLLEKLKIHFSLYSWSPCGKQTLNSYVALFVEKVDAQLVNG